MAPCGSLDCIGGYKLAGCVVRIQCWLVGELAGGFVIGSLVPAGLLVAGWVDESAGLLGYWIGMG